MTIYDYMTAKELAAYWEVLSQDVEPFPGEELFPADKKRGLSLKWIKGAKGLPVALKSSAFDVYAMPRPRLGFDTVRADMPYFKESMYIDEELRQELNMVLETGNQTYIDSIMNNVFDDEATLLTAAAVTREAMRMQMLTSGVISLLSNGQVLTYDYGIEHKANAGVAWKNYDTANPIEDLRALQEKIQDETGVKPTRAMMDGVTWRNLRNNEMIKKQVFVLTNGVGNLNDTRLRDFLLEELELSVYVNDKRYKLEQDGEAVKYVPSNTVAIFPEGALGKTWFGTTPAESDLMSSRVANVSIVDTGVAVLTRQIVDPVNVETIVSQITLPSFERANEVGILDTEPA